MVSEKVTVSLFLCSLLLACGEPTKHVRTTTALRNVDVTIVFPLPPSGRIDELISPSTESTGAPYLSFEMFPLGVPGLDARASLSAEDVFASLRLVALRLDPCTGVTTPDSTGAACTPEIRAVFQSVYSTSDGLWARDGAIHVFYRLRPTDFDEVIDELRAFRADHTSDPEVRLDVHPHLREQGINGTYALAIKSILARHAVRENAARVTSFSLVESAFMTWAFEIAELRDSGWVRAPIATTSATTQQLATFSGGRWDADIAPMVTHADDVTRIFRVSESERQSAFTAVPRVLNPRIHSSESIDCATCHIASDVGAFARVALGLNESLALERFTSKYDLSAASRSDDEAVAFDNIHMLSYLGKALSVSPRVANETAAVLERLNPM